VEKGKLLRTWGIQRDVTERVKIEESRKVAEEALRKSEAHFRILVEQASDGIFIADGQGRYLDVNSAGAEMLGYSRDDILGLSIADVVASEEIPRIPLETAHFATGNIVRSEWKFRRKDGSFFPGEVVGRQLPDGRMQGILRDNTERKQAEDSLRRSEERFRVALKNSPVTVFNQDHDLRYTWLYNSQVQPEEHILGKTESDFLDADTDIKLREIKRRVLESGVGVRIEVPVLCEGKKRYFDVTLEPLLDSTGAIVGITGAALDIAKLRELTDKLREEKDKLVQEKLYLESEIQSELGFEKIIGHSPALKEVLKHARVAAPTDATVLLLGETGTGKQLVARSVHQLSPRHDRNFIKLNCAAVPSGLLESELFGYEKGAFTSAANQKPGRVELADKGTLFLDEIGELPLELQPKL
jgi:formate hydrogenlyase transcriptional activator